MQTQGDKCKGLQATRSPELGDKRKGLQGSSWETNVKGCKQEGERGGTCKGKKEDEADTMTNKKGDNKGDKNGDKRTQKGNKTDTVPNKKGDKTGDKGR